MTESRAVASAEQQAYWMLRDIDPDGYLYNIAWVLTLRRPVAPERLRAAVSTVVGRHGALRTRFDAIDGVPVQVLSASAAVPVEVCDLRAAPAAEQAAIARRIRARDAATIFDLSRGPLLRVTLARLADDVNDLLLTAHHSVCDGRSMEVIAQELLALLTDPGAAARWPSPGQYADVAARQHARHTGEAMDRLLAYWRGQLTGVPWLVSLPMDRPRRDAGSTAGARHALPLDRPLMAQITAVARQHRVTEFVVVLAAVGVLLSRQCGQESVLIGAPLSGRDRRALHNVVGPLVTTVPLRVDTAGEPDVATLLGRVRTVLLDALTHRDLPFDRLVECLRPERDRTANPLVQVMVAYHESVGQELPSWATVTATELGVVKFDLVLTIDATDPESSFIEYRSALFDRERIADLSDQLGTLLRDLVADQSRPISRLGALSAAAQRRVLVDWNATAAPVPEGGIARFVEAQVRRAPDCVALVAGTEHVTYGQLNRLANGIAHRLLARGVRPDDRIGLCAGRSIPFVVAVLAVLKAGAGVVPLDPELPPARARLLLDDADVRLVLAEPGLLDAVATTRPVVDLTPASAGCSGADPDLPVWPDQLAFVLYTSGSTGRPKGVMVTHRGVVNYVFWCIREFDVTAGAGVPVHGSIGFDTTIITSLLPPLFTGQRVHLYGGRAAPAVALAEVAESALDHSYLALTPSQLRLLLIRRRNAARPVPARMIVVGGETLHGHALPVTTAGTLACRVINEYGPTETVAACCALRLPADKPPPETVPIGHPIANTTAYAVDGHGQPVPVGEQGQLLIGGAGVARGYLDRPGLTASVFRPVGIGPAAGERGYRTGDEVRFLPSGALEFLGRVDDQVKIRGHRVEPDEVAAAVTADPAVRAGTVLARPAPDGTGDELIAYVVPGDGLSVEELHGRLAGTLPAALLPAGYVLLDALPISPNGKVVHAALAGHEPVRPGGREPFVAPAPGVEARIAAIWGALLGVDQVGVRDNFFAHGGHSLAGARLLARIADEFGVQLPLHVLFDDPTVRGLARCVSGDGPTPAVDPVRPGDGGTDGRTQLAPAQEGLWFAGQLRPATARYNTGAGYRLDGPLRPDDLAASFADLLRRHDVLRAVVTEVDGRPCLEYLPADSIPLRRLDLSGQPPDAARAHARQLLDTAAGEPFDPAAGPLVRACLIRLDATEHLFVLVIHHLVVDGPSMGILLRDLATLYAARLRCVSAPAANPLRYADYAAWQRRRLGTEPLARQRAYWAAVLAAPPGPIDWPSAGTAGGVEPVDARHRFDLPAGLRDRLAALARQTGTTMFMAVLAGFAALLHRQTGRDDILVATALDARTRPETVELVGYLVNLVVLRLRMDGSPTVRDLLERTRERAVGAYAHPDLSLSELMGTLRPGRDRSGRDALTQVLFTFQPESEPVPALDGLTSDVIHPRRRFAPADLALTVTDTGEGLVGEFAFDPDALSPAVVERFADRLGVLLEGMSASPDARVVDLPMVTARERDLLLRWSEGD